MSEQQYTDPSGNTEQFRAFVQRTEPVQAEGKSLPMGLLIGGLLVVAVAVVVVAWLVVG
jgi:hypothetical protein